MASKDRGTQKDSFVRVENANLTRLSLRKMSLLYTDYADLIIRVGELHKQKQELKKKIWKDVSEIKEGFKRLYEALPKEVPREVAKIAKRIETVVEIEPKEEEFEARTDVETFEALKNEFQRIRHQLEKIK
jgi:hypothetical protein